MPRLNYHHLYYFWQVARSGNLTRTANALHVSQSALSTQIRQLEETFGTELFIREGRRLSLSPTGERAMLLANDIFQRGEELETLLRQGLLASEQHLRIGMVSTMSRNFIDGLLAPLLGRAHLSFSLQAMGISRLLDALAKQQLDVVLSNINISANREQPWQVQLLARQAVSVVGPPGRRPRSSFPNGYTGLRWLLPGAQSEMRAAFDAFCSLHRYEPDVQAEVEDMAMLRLLARDSGSLAVLPQVVVRDEIESGALVEYLSLPNAFESFYAITVKRSFQPLVLSELLANAQTLD